MKTMNHCKNCGNNIPENTATCEEARFGKCNSMTNKCCQFEEGHSQECINYKEEKYLGQRCENHPDFFPDECGCLIDFIEQTIHQETTKAVEEIDILINHEEIMLKSEYNDFTAGMITGLRMAKDTILQPTNNTKETK